jgi:TatD DNase family protein
MTSSAASSSISQPILVDVDCNLWHSDLKSLQDITESADKLDILEEDAVFEQYICAMISPSSTIQEAVDGIDRLQQYKGRLSIKTTVGVHPYHVNDEELQSLSLEQHLDVMRTMLQDNRVYCAAVGECGLDASQGFPPLEDQIPWFHAQIALAEELRLPLFVHERLGFETCLEMLKDASVPIIIHCFTGTVEECCAYMQRGYSISFSGYLYKQDASETCECLRQGIIPLDKLMIETDAPYMGFVGCRDHYVSKNADYVNALNSKKRKRLLSSTYPNVPSALPMVLDKVLEEINAGRSKRKEALLSRQELAEATTRNALLFFKLEVS